MNTNRLLTEFGAFWSYYCRWGARALAGHQHSAPRGGLGGGVTAFMVRDCQLYIELRAQLSVHQAKSTSAWQLEGARYTRWTDRGKDGMETLEMAAEKKGNRDK